MRCSKFYELCEIIDCLRLKLSCLFAKSMLHVNGFSFRLKIVNHYTFYHFQYPIQALIRSHFYRWSR